MLESCHTVIARAVGALLPTRKPRESRLGLDEEALCDTGSRFACMVAIDIYQVLPGTPEAVDILAHGRIFSPARPSRASRSIDFHSVRVILTAGPSSPSRSLVSSSCLARRF